MLTTPGITAGGAIARAPVQSPDRGPRIQRLPAAGKGGSSLVRLFCTVRWHYRVAKALHQFRPDVILSVETHSALAVWLYRVVFRGRAVLVIQHYEYAAPEDYYRKGNRLLWLNRFFERCLFPTAHRVTQTNPDRLRLFHADNPQLRSAQLAVWPNYPPASWRSDQHRPWPITPAGPLRLVFVGAVSLRDTWIGQVAKWIAESGQNTCTLDVYASRCDQETADYLEALACERLRFHKGGVPYSSLPQVLRNFDVGLILYRGNTLNFVWNETNKLFEYLICGLDVWYPPCMKSIARLQNNTTLPRILGTDFENLSEIQINSRLQREYTTVTPWIGTCEDVFTKVLADIIKN